MTPWAGAKKVNRRGGRKAGSSDLGTPGGCRDPTPTLATPPTAPASAEDGHTVSVLELHLKCTVFLSRSPFSVSKTVGGWGMNETQMKEEVSQH